MILSGQRIRELQIVSPHVERTTISRDNGITLSYGEGPAGYDIRVEFDDIGGILYKDFNKGEFLLCSSIEHFRMPKNVIGVVHDKSTWARKGIAVQNTILEPGWEGYLTLELTNHGQKSIALTRGDPIAQVIFHETYKTESTYNGKYQKQSRGPQEAR